ncbi:MAG: enoyl-CoA hydratase/isomerase family protein [Pseudomonadales bacterium]|jgi:enoyl-CoA hydratase|tara:strand:- start:3 stop:743 length:741 start_codon:yes stop_codon:yes gene_type:complete
MTEALVEREDDNGIAILTLNRPKALNSLSPSLFVELRAHIENIAGSVEIGCVILRGKGRSFSAGNDLNAITSGDVAPSKHYQAETLDLIANMPQPVIASVQGHCYTGSLELALACDLLIASDSAKFADTHGKWGMTPTWGMSQRLPRRIGPLKAKEMMFTGRIVSGLESVALGLANECVADEDLIPHTISLAQQIVANSWHTLKADKSLVNQGLDLHLTDGLAWERANSPGAGPDMKDRLANFGKK